MKISASMRAMLVRVAQGKSRRVGAMNDLGCWTTLQACKRRGFLTEGAAITKKGAVAIHCHNELQCLAPESCICLCGHCALGKTTVHKALP